MIEASQAKRGKAPAIRSPRVPKICAELGLEILPTNKKPGPGQTTAGATLHAIYRGHGEGHLIMLLRTLLESEGGSEHVNEFTLMGISDVMLAHPEWPSKGLAWLEAFDKVDLGDIREQARRNRQAVPQRHGIANALHRELSEMFDPANCVQFTRTEESTVPIDNDLLYGTRNIARFLEIPVDKCQRLIAEGNLPVFQMPGATTRCARKSTLNAFWGRFEQASVAASRAA
ncbi:hypothetical protein [Bradyrhizobium sp. AZCC 2289]|uniref:hypothetical protein n=1 Tax=Bradyrhizobium sp. AZCC 2289 TaxID=3117026 RepID=UPI002FEFBAF4